MLYRRAYDYHTSIVVYLGGLVIFGGLLLSGCGGGGSSGGGTASYAVGGTATNVAGTGLMLQLNGGSNLAVSNGTFSFPTRVANGANYTVSVASQPSNPAQTCTLANNTGTISGANVTNVAVTCTTNTYTVGGSISGLSGSVVLQDNGADNLTVSASGSFTFAAKVASGAGYQVTVMTQPAGELCRITSGASGTVTNANITSVQITCSSDSFTVGGTVNGLNGSGLALQDNGGDTLAVAASGTFTFPTSVVTGQPYAVTVMQQPSSSPSQYCTVSNGSGTMGSVNVNNVVVTCRNQGQYLYVTTTYGGGGSTTQAGGGTTSLLGINSDGTLILDHISAAGLNPLGIALDPSGQYLYVSSEYSYPTTDGYVYTDNIQTSGGNAGLFSDNGSPADNGSGTSTYSVAVDPAAAYVFAGGTSSGPGTGALYAYSTSSGVLSQLGSSPYTVNGDPYGLAVDPTGKFLYVPNSDGGQVWGYSINSDGSLTSLSGSPFTFQGGASGGTPNTPYAIAINPNGGYLYITDNSENTVTVYSYDPGSGALSEVGNPYLVGKIPESVTVDPTGQFLYVANSGDGTVSGFTINASTGALTPMSGSPFTTGGGASSTPTAVAIEPSGQYAYVANGDASTITVFSITPGSGILSVLQSAAPCPDGATCTVGGQGGTGGASALAIE